MATSGEAGMKKMLPAILGGERNFNRACEHVRVRALSILSPICTSSPRIETLSMISILASWWKREGKPCLSRVGLAANSPITQLNCHISDLSVSLRAIPRCAIGSIANDRGYITYDRR